MSSAVPESMPREAGRAIFGSGAQAYHEARSGYPEALFEHLRDRSSAAPRILEIGPGSGLATEGLLTLQPVAYVGIEADQHFVSYLQTRFSQAHMRFVNAPFPDSGLEGPYDLAACAAAFHWLEPNAALAALRALLRPGGLWAVWWNSYLNPGPDAPFATSAMDILREEGVALPPSFSPAGHLSLDVASQTALLRDSGMVDITHRRWDVARSLDAPAAEELFCSFSFIRALPETERTRILDRIRGLVKGEFRGLADNVVTTTCYTSRTPSTGPMFIP